MKIIVGITSWKKRIDQVSKTLNSLLNQTRKPDSIELNLDYENFPNGLKDLPESVAKLPINISFADKDRKVWLKIIPSIRRHFGEDYILITADDDVTYPETYVEEVEKNLQDADWLCSQHDDATMGEYMAYKSTALNKMAPYLSYPLIDQIPLDDHLIFYLLMKVRAKRGKKINAKCDDRDVGYGYRRLFNTEMKPEDCKKTTCDYPRAQFEKERDLMHKFGII